MAMRADDGSPSADLLRLASKVACYLHGTPAAPGRIDEPFAQFAMSRHGMGQVLLAAAGDDLDDDVLALLQTRRKALVRRQAFETLQLMAVDTCLTAAGVPWLILKGSPQAALLYGDAALRPSVDVDVLVPPEKFAEAFAALRRLGWTAARPKWLPQAFGLPLMRDVDLYAPGAIPFHVELHQRPLYLEPFATTGADLFATAARRPLPAPMLGAPLAYFLFAHGTLSGWCRLKWLADFSLVITRLDETGAQALLAKAVRQNVGSALAASILLAIDVFRPAAQKVLARWAEPLRTQSSVRRLYGVFWTALTSPDVMRRTPFASRGEAFKIQFLCYRSWLARGRLMAMAPLAAVARNISGFTHNFVGSSQREA